MNKSHGTPEQVVQNVNEKVTGNYIKGRRLTLHMVHRKDKRRTRYINMQRFRSNHNLRQIFFYLQKCHFFALQH